MNCCAVFDANITMTAKEGEKYTKRADETRLLIDELEEKKEEPTEADLKNIEDLKAKEQLETAYAVSENKLNKLVLSSRQFSPKVALKSSALSFSLFLLLAF
jgi:hypothetical protein